MTSPEPSSRRPPEPQSCDPRLLELLVCPLTKGPLQYQAATSELVSRKAHVAYPVRNGVPVLTQEAARPLAD
jgi:uncharacterized protein YbaR (Trm112 family)